MRNPNLYLPGFHLVTLRRKPRSPSQKLADQLGSVSHETIKAKLLEDHIVELEDKARRRESEAA